MRDQNPIDTDTKKPLEYHKIEIFLNVDVLNHVIAVITKYYFPKAGDLDPPPFSLNKTN